MAKQKEEVAIEVVGEEQFKKEVLGHRGLPVLVQFHATWCGPCRAASVMLDELVSVEPGKFKFVKVDADKNPELRDQYGVRSIPHFVVFRDGKVIGKRMGMETRGAFWKWLEPQLAKV